MRLKSQQKQPPRMVRCPTCGGPSRYDATNPYRPFCSQRCKLRDLGAWASERYRVQSTDSPDLNDRGADDSTAARGESS